MKLEHIIEEIERVYPVASAMEWDNPGLQAGRRDKEVKKIYVALDATDTVIEQAAAAGADLLLTHHPLIFGGIKKVTDENLTGRRIVRLLEEGICCYSMHTNYDVLRMADLAGERMGLENPEVLEVTEPGETPRGIGKTGTLKEPVTLEAYGRKIKEIFQLSEIRVFGDPNASVKKVAVCPGSGKSVIEEALEKQADVLVTGDIGHHEGIDAYARGMAIIDAGHYGLEHIFTGDMARFCREYFQEVETVPAPVSHPFWAL